MVKHYIKVLHPMYVKRYQACYRKNGKLIVDEGVFETATAAETRGRELQAAVDAESDALKAKLKALEANDGAI